MPNEFTLSHRKGKMAQMRSGWKIKTYDLQTEHPNGFRYILLNVRVYNIIFMYFLNYILHI